MKHSPEQSYLRELFENLDIGVLVADDNATYVDANQKACDSLGRIRSAVIGRHVSDIIENGREAEVNVQWKAFLRDGEQSGLFGVCLPDGTKRTIQFHAKANFVPGLHCSFITAAADAHEHGDEPEVLRMCAWTKRVFWEGEWIPIEDYLRDAHSLRVSHGICPEAFSVVNE